MQCTVHQDRLPELQCIFSSANGPAGTIIPSRSADGPECQRWSEPCHGGQGKGKRKVKRHGRRSIIVPATCRYPSLTPPLIRLLGSWVTLLRRNNFPRQRASNSFLE